MLPHATTEQERELASTGKILLQWAGFLIPPLAFLLHLQLQYILVPFACDGSMLMLHLSTLGMLLVAGGGGWLAWREWERVGRAWPGKGADVPARSRFMAAMGVVNGAFFAMVILAQWLPILFLSPCHRL